MGEELEHNVFEKRPNRMPEPIGPSCEFRGLMNGCHNRALYRINDHGDICEKCIPGAVHQATSHGRTVSIRRL